MNIDCNYRDFSKCKFEAIVFFIACYTNPNKNKLHTLCKEHSLMFITKKKTLTKKQYMKYMVLK